MTVAVPVPPTGPSSKGDAGGDEGRQRLATSSELFKSTGFVYVLTGLSAISGLLFGYDTGVVSGAMLLIGKEFKLNIVWHEVIVSGTIAAAWVFSLVGGYTADKFGRKNTILCASTVFTIGSLIMGVANSKAWLIVGRIVVGAGVGLSSMSAPVYIAESSHADVRGVMVTIYTLGITFGQFTAGIVCGSFSKVHEGWRYMLGLAALPAAIQFVSFLFMPESPRWLVSNGRLEDAKAVLIRIRGHGRNINREVEAIRKTCEEERQANPGTSRLATCAKILKLKHTRRALFLGCSLQAIQQLAGINTVMYYSASIIQMAGIGDYSLAIWISSGVAGTNFLCTFIGIFLIDRIGRRPLTLISLLGVVVALLNLGIGFLLVDLQSPQVDHYNADNLCGSFKTCSDCIADDICGFCFRSGNSSCWPLRDPGPCAAASHEFTGTGYQPVDPYTWAVGWCPSHSSWVTITALCLYLLFFSPGMGSTPWTINSEIYPLWARSISMSVATSCNWLFNLIISLTFLSLTKALTTYGTFFMYSGITLLGFIFLWFKLPETRGVALENMALLFGASPTDDVDLPPSSFAPPPRKAKISKDKDTAQEKR